MLSSAFPWTVSLGFNRRSIRHTSSLLELLSVYAMLIERVIDILSSSIRVPRSCRTYFFRVLRSLRMVLK